MTDDQTWLLVDDVSCYSATAKRSTRPAAQCLTLNALSYYTSIHPHVDFWSWFTSYIIPPSISKLFINSTELMHLRPRRLFYLGFFSLGFVRFAVVSAAWRRWPIRQESGRRWSRTRYFIYYPWKKFGNFVEIQTRINVGIIWIYL
jgi:hypothetical protein